MQVQHAPDSTGTGTVVGTAGTVSYRYQVPYQVPYWYGKPVCIDTTVLYILVVMSQSCNIDIF